MNAPPDTPTISVVAPIFNEADNVGRFVAAVDGVLSGLSDAYEVVIVDDGSDDRTWKELCALADAIPALRAVRLSRNFGQQAALLAGLTVARGRAIITMDGDLQHPPEMIPHLVDLWRSGFQIVNTQRQDGETAQFTKRAMSRLYYRMFSYLADVRLEAGSSDFRLLDRRVLNALLSLRDNDVFIRGAVQFLGFRTTVFPFAAAARTSGASKFTLAKMLKLARSGIVSHSTKPLTIGIWTGLITALLALSELIYILVKVGQGDTVPGWASTLGVNVLLFAVTFLLLGLLGVYVGSIHRLLQARPRFIVAEDTSDRVGSSRE